MVLDRQKLPQNHHMTTSLKNCPGAMHAVLPNNISTVGGMMIVLKELYNTSL